MNFHSYKSSFSTDNIIGHHIFAECTVLQFSNKEQETKYEQK